MEKKIEVEEIVKTFIKIIHINLSKKNNLMGI